MTPELVAQHLATLSPVQLAEFCDQVVEIAINIIPEPNHEAITTTLATKGILISQGSQMYSFSICGRKKTPPAH